MEGPGRISPFQLTILLFLSRLFTMMTYLPAGAADERTGLILLLGLFFSPLLQMALLQAGFFFCRDRGSFSPLSFSQKGTEKTGRALAVGYWMLLGLICLYSTLELVRFLSQAFYGGGFLWVLAAFFCAAGGFCAHRGLEALCRASTVLLGLTIVGLILLGAGMAGTADPRNFLMPAWEKRLFLRGLWQGAAMNFELILLLLLQPFTTQGRLRTGAIWLLLWGGALLTVSMGLGVMFSLGYYAQGQAYPLFSAAQSARLLFMERLDSAFLGLWILLGLVKVTLLLWLMAQIGGKILKRPVSGKMVAAHSLGLLAAVVTLLYQPALTNWMKWAMTTGWIPLTGVLLFPGIGFIVQWRGKRR